MTKLLRLAALAAVSATALALSATALAAYTSPTLTIESASHKVGGGGPLTVKIEADRNDDATFRVVIYVPQGYVTSLVQPAGSTIGQVEGAIQANAISPDAIVPVSGSITAQNYTPQAFPTGQACAGAGVTINQVYVLQLQASGQTLLVPMYVTTIQSGPEAAFASAKFTVCLPSPYVPQAQGGANLGAKLVSASMTFTNLFTNPSTRGDYRWRALLTPWTVGTAVPNPAGTVEVQAVDRLGANLVLSTRAFKRKVRGKTLRYIRISGRLTENLSGVGGARVTLLLGRTARGVRSIGAARTTLRGTFVRTVRVARFGRYYVNARTTVPARSTSCVKTEIFPAAVPCLRATLDGFSIAANRVVSVRVPR